MTVWPTRETGLRDWPPDLPIVVGSSFGVADDVPRIVDAGHVAGVAAEVRMMPPSERTIGVPDRGRVGILDRRPERHTLVLTRPSVSGELKRVIRRMPRGRIPRRPERALGLLDGCDRRGGAPPAVRARSLPAIRCPFTTGPASGRCRVHRWERGTTAVRATCLTTVGRDPMPANWNAITTAGRCIATDDEASHRRSARPGRPQPTCAVTGCHRSCAFGAMVPDISWRGHSARVPRRG